MHDRNAPRLSIAATLLLFSQAVYAADNTAVIKIEFERFKGLEVISLPQDTCYAVAVYENKDFYRLAWQVADSLEDAIKKALVLCWFSKCQIKQNGCNK